MTRMSAVISCQFLVFSQGTKNRAMGLLEVGEGAAASHIASVARQTRCGNWREYVGVFNDEVKGSPCAMDVPGCKCA
jgi:hypothetical protein